MDTRRLVTGMVLAMAVVFGWTALMGYLGKKYNWQQPTADSSPAATQPDVAAPDGGLEPPTTGAASTGVSTATRSTGSAPTLVASNPSGLRPSGTGSPDAVVALGSAVANDPDYPLQLQISPRGAGLDRVVLNRFRQKVGEPDRYVFQEPFGNPQALTRSLAVKWAQINGRRVYLADADWRLERQTAESATYAVDVSDAGARLATLTRIYAIRSRESTGGGYEIEVSTGIENTSGAAMTAQIAYQGPGVPPREIDRGPDRQIISAYDKNGRVMLGDHHFIESFDTGEKRKQTLSSHKDGYPLLWAGTASVYFNALVLPRPIDGVNGRPFESVEASAINPQDAPEQRAIEMTFQTPALTLAPGASAKVAADVFLGPKQRALLNDPHYALFPRGYDQTLLSGSSCNFCTFPWLVNGLVWLLRAFHAVVRDWGLAIIALVVLVRVILHPITKRSTISMQKMGKMGPEIERLKKKYADDKDELNRQMMQVYKTQGMTPVLGCLPMFLQMPIWVALWTALQSTFELRQAPLLYGLTWVKDLAKPDHLIYFPNHPINLWFFHVDALNLLPVLMGVVFFLQQKFQPRPPAATKEQEQQQKMMLWMSVALFPLFLYNGPSGLNLYILTSTTIGIFESKRIRDHIREREAAEKAERVIIEARPTRGSKRREEEAVPPAKGVAGMMQRLAQRVEEMRKEKRK